MNENKAIVTLFVRLQYENNNLILNHPDHYILKINLCKIKCSLIAPKFKYDQQKIQGFTLERRAEEARRGGAGRRGRGEVGGGALGLRGRWKWPSGHSWLQSWLAAPRPHLPLPTPGRQVGVTPRRRRHCRPPARLW